MTTVVIAIVAVVLLGLAVAAHLAVAWLRNKENATSAKAGGVRRAHSLRAQLRLIQESILANQDLVSAAAARLDVAADGVLAATVANTAAVEALRAEVAAGTVEVPLDTTALDAAVAKVEAAAAAAVVPAAVV